MEGTKVRPIDISEEFYSSLQNVFDYGVEFFGVYQALKYENLIYEEIKRLPSRYFIHPECRHIPTKSKMYRSIMLSAHFILYRITDSQIEVLDIISYKESISHIRSRQQIKL